MIAPMSSLTIGQVLFEETLPASGRAHVALFSHATQDPNPIHVDDDFARRAGFATVLQQGPMTTAQFARLLQQFAGAHSLRMLDITFTAPVYPDDSLILRAQVIQVGDTVRCALTASKLDGTKTASGEAELSIDR
jgi:acyl dehydratase